MREKNKKAKSSKKTGGLTARNADRHFLYENSVQCTEASIEIIEKVYFHEQRKSPLTLREDFCGTAKLCADWVESSAQRKSLGVDNHMETLSWAQSHNIAPLPPDAQNRVELLLSDVLLCNRGGFDVIAAFNFSYWTFQQRAVLKQYFKKVHEGLNENGLFILDIYGGPDSQFVMEEETEHENFTYVWDQARVDPINNHIICHIHYRFPDDTEMTDAFTYDWRIWSIPELRDILKEVGFSRTETWWDCEDDILRPKKEVENLISWIAYLAAWK